MINSSYFKSLSRFPLLGHSRNAPVAFLVTSLRKHRGPTKSSAELDGPSNEENNFSPNIFSNPSEVGDERILN